MRTKTFFAYKSTTGLFHEPIKLNITWYNQNLRLISENLQISFILLNFQCFSYMNLRGSS